MSNVRYNLRHSGKKRINTQLLYISTARYGEDWASVPHTHPFAELFYILEGSGVVSIEQRRIAVSEGDVVIVNPGMPHTERSNPGQPLEYIVLGVSGLSFRFEDGSEGGSSAQSFRKHRGEIQQYFNILLDEVRKNRDDSEIICHNLLEVLLLMIMRHASCSVEEAKPQVAGRECAIAKRFIDEQFKTNITLDELAAHTHINKYYLAHSFTRAFGVSPIHYLMKKRLEESLSLLLTTDFSIAYIAATLGFSSASYFSQAFSRAYHQSPRAYREACRRESSARG